MAAGLSAGVAFIDILPDMTRFASGLTAGMRKAGMSMQYMGRTLTHSITLPIAAAGVASLKWSMDFQREMVKIQTQAGNATVDIGMLSDKVLAMSGDVATGPEELAKGLYHIESVGGAMRKTPVALETLRVAALGAKVGGADLEDTASVLAGAMRALQLPVGKTSATMAELTGIVGSGNMRMNEMVDALKSGILPTARIAGLSLRGIGAAIATMTDESVPAGVAANRLRTALFMLTNPTDKAKKALKSIGLTSLSLGHDMQRPDGLFVAMKDLRKHLEDIHDPTKRLALIGSMFGGSRSAGTIAMLMNNLEMVRQKYGQISTVADKYNKSVAKTRETAQFKLDQQWAAIQSAMIDTGNILIPIALDLADKVKSVAEAFNDLGTSTQRYIVYGALFLAALGPVIGLVGSLLTLFSALGTAAIFMGTGLVRVIGLIPGFTVALEAGEGALISFGAAEAIALGPLELFALGIAAVGIAAAGIIYYLSSSSDETSQLDDAAKHATDSVNGLFDALDKSKQAHRDYTEAVHRHTAAVHQVADAEKRVNDLVKAGKKGTLEYKQAVDQVNSAQDNLRRSEDDVYNTHEKLKKQREASKKAIDADRTASSKLIDKYKEQLRAIDRVAKGNGYLGQAYKHSQPTINATRKNTQKLVDSMFDLAKAHTKNAHEAMQKGLPALAKTEKHLAAVDTATGELIQQLGRVPTQKEIQVQLTIDQFRVTSSYGAPLDIGPGSPRAAAAARSRAGGGGDGGGGHHGGGHGHSPPGSASSVVRNPGSMLSAMPAGGGGSTRVQMTITNWATGTGHFTNIVDDVNDSQRRAHKRHAGMKRI